MTSSDIYHSKCSCIHCHKVFHACSLHTHTQRMHDKSQTNYTGKTAKAHAALLIKMQASRVETVQKYNLNPKRCEHCNQPISYEKKKNRFCSSSCSTSFNNSKRDYATFRSGPPRGFRPPYTKVKQCSVCSKWHSRKGISCSTSCKSVLQSRAVRKRIDNGWNPQQNRNRSTPSFLEKSFEAWLISNHSPPFIKEKTFRCHDKTFFGDFFFPSVNLLIELDGKQHVQQADYDKHRDDLIFKYHNVTTFRISYREFVTKSKYNQVCSLLGITNTIRAPQEPRTPTY